MSSKTSSGFGLGTIIFWIVMGFLWFGDSNDEPDTTIEIVSQEENVINVEVREELKNVGKGLVNIAEQLKNNISETVTQIQEDIEPETTIEEPQEVIRADDNSQELTPITNNQKEDEVLKQL